MSLMYLIEPRAKSIIRRQLWTVNFRSPTASTGEPKIGASLSHQSAEGAFLHGIFVF